MIQSHDPPSADRGTSRDPALPLPSAAADRPAPDHDDIHIKEGTVELRSGRWKWMAHVGELGSAVVFHDERSPNNRMRALLRQSDATDEAVLQGAREPDLRWWEDPVGNVWEVRVEQSSFTMRREQRSRPRHRIVFHEAARHLGTELPEGRALGELTSAELTALLYQSR